MQNYDDLLHDPQLAHRGHFQRVPHVHLGELEFEHYGIRLSESPPRLETPGAAGEIGDAALPLCADVSDPASVRNAFAAAHEAFGRLDVVVNNAAIGPLYRLEDASDAELQATVGTNFLGVLYCTRATPWGASRAYLTE